VVEEAEPLGERGHLVALLIWVGGGSAFNGAVALWDRWTC
jgi:hypothetical protein